jgi:hypothetical protein
MHVYGCHDKLLGQDHGGGRHAHDGWSRRSDTQLEPLMMVAFMYIYLIHHTDIILHDVAAGWLH